MDLCHVALDPSGPFLAAESLVVGLVLGYLVRAARGRRRRVSVPVDPSRARHVDVEA